MKKLLALGSLAIALAASQHAVYGQATWASQTTGGNWATPGNWTGTAPVNDGTSALTFDTATANRTYTNDLTNLTVSSLTVTGSSHDNTINGNKFTLSGDFTDNTGSWQWINTDIGLTGTRTFTINSGQLTIGGNLTDGTSAGGILKTGGSWLYINGTNNTFTGNTLITNGKMILSNGLSLQNSAFDTASMDGGQYQGLDVTASPTLTLGGLTGSGNLASKMYGYTSVTALTLNPQTGQAYSGNITNGSGATTLTKTGAGTQKLSGNNTYSGGTTLNNGVIEVQSNTALGTGTVQVNSGGWVSIQESYNVSNAITLNGGTLGWHYTSGAGVYSGPINLAANSTVSLANYYGYGSVSGTISGNISGPGGLTVNNTDRGGTAQGGGTLTLSGTNTYTGATTLSAGTMVVSSTGSLSGTSVDVASGATLNLASGSIYTLKINGLSATQVTGSGTVSLDGHFAFDLSAAGTVSGTIWQIVANSTLAETYGIHFTVDSFSNAGGGLWTKVVGANTYSFDQGLGQLSVVPEPATWALLAFSLTTVVVFRRRRSA